MRHIQSIEGVIPFLAVAMPCTIVRSLNVTLSMAIFPFLLTNRSDYRQNSKISGFKYKVYILL